MSLDPGSTWKVTRAPQLHWCDYDGQRVLYDEATGDTHLLEPVALSVLELCRDRDPAPDFQTILQTVIPLVDFGCDDVLQNFCEELVRRLSRLELIEKII